MESLLLFGSGTLLVLQYLKEKRQRRLGGVKRENFQIYNPPNFQKDKEMLEPQEKGLGRKLPEFDYGNGVFRDFVDNYRNEIPRQNLNFSTAGYRPQWMKVNDPVPARQEVVNAPPEQIPANSIDRSRMYLDMFNAQTRYLKPEVKAWNEKEFPIHPPIGGPTGYDPVRGQLPVARYNRYALGEDLTQLLPQDDGRSRGFASNLAAQSELVREEGVNVMSEKAIEMRPGKLKGAFIGKTKPTYQWENGNTGRGATIPLAPLIQYNAPRLTRGVDVPFSESGDGSSRFQGNGTAFRDGTRVDDPVRAGLDTSRGLKGSGFRPHVTLGTDRSSQYTFHIRQLFDLPTADAKRSNVLQKTSGAPQVPVTSVTTARPLSTLPNSIKTANPITQSGVVVGKIGVPTITKVETGKLSSTASRFPGLVVKESMSKALDRKSVQGALGVKNDAARPIVANARRAAHFEGTPRTLDKPSARQKNSLPPPVTSTSKTRVNMTFPKQKTIGTMQAPTNRNELLDADGVATNSARAPADFFTPQRVASSSTTNSNDVVMEKAGLLSKPVRVMGPTPTAPYAYKPLGTQRLPGEMRRR